MHAVHCAVAVSAEADARWFLRRDNENQQLLGKCVFPCFSFSLNFKCSVCHLSHFHSLLPIPLSPSPFPSTSSTPSSLSPNQPLPIYPSLFLFTVSMDESCLNYLAFVLIISVFAFSRKFHWALPLGRVNRSRCKKKRQLRSVHFW